MDDTVIKEIADQLGIATDQAAQFITTYLPQYASLKTMLCISYCVIAAVVFAIVLIAFCIVLHIYTKRDADPDIMCYENEGLEEASVALGIAAVSLFVVFVVICAINIPNAIGWSQFPEAQLISEAINAIKG